MNITANTEGTKACFTLEGKLTVQTSPDLEAAISELGSDVAYIDIDLTNVSYVSSAGLRVFVGAEKLTVARGGQLRLLHPTDEVMEVFEMTGLSEIFEIER